MRQLPDDLLVVLGRVSRQEFLAEGQRQQRQAIAATGALLLAATCAGWQQRELAHALGLSVSTVGSRIATARRRFGDTVPALIVDPPLATVDARVVLELAVAEREWLSGREAAALAGVNVSTIYNWQRAGILPNTHVLSPWRRLYLRADLLRVTHAQPYNSRGVHYSVLARQIRQAGV